MAFRFVQDVEHVKSLVNARTNNQRIAKIAKGSTSGHHAQPLNNLEKHVNIQVLGPSGPRTQAQAQGRRDLPRPWVLACPGSFIKGPGPQGAGGSCSPSGFGYR